MDEDENITKKKSYEIGFSLDNFSVEDIEEYLLALDEEIKRVKGIKSDKVKALDEAKNFFKG